MYKIEYIFSSFIEPIIFAPRKCRSVAGENGSGKSGSFVTATQRPLAAPLYSNRHAADTTKAE
jgi:hypothetical protein